MDVERVQLQPCFVLHQRPYKNTSLIIDVLSRDFGRTSLVAKGVKQAKSPLRSVLHTFQPLSLSWVRRSDLGTLTTAEFLGSAVSLERDRLYAGLYLNELLVRLLVQHDPVQEIFAYYDETLSKLQTCESVEINLRLFEKQLLQVLGYEIGLTEEAETHRLIDSEAHYQYIPEHGFIKTDKKSCSSYLFKGKHLLAFGMNDFTDSDVLKAAHRITFISLKRLLGDKPLKTRELISALRNTMK